MTTATICTIGDEILIGQIIDTNSSMISLELGKIGVKVESMISCSDSENDIIDTLNLSLKRSDIIVVTGGLGPTKDDITKQALAKLTGCKTFVRNNKQLDIIKRLLIARGIKMTDINKNQALVPKTAKVILNQVGTAPIMEFSFFKNGKKKLLFSMPGVPFETENALEDVIKSIKGHFQLQNILHKTICTFGLPESTLAKLIEQWENSLDKRIHLAYLPNPVLGVRLRLSIYGIDNKEGKAILSKSIRSLKKILGNHIYGYDSTDPIEAISKILIDKRATLSVAESCTGGFVSHLLTKKAGASKYFWGSIISYDNSVKINMLGVKEKTISNYGAVSKECVEEMAKGARKHLNTTYSIATSGIAGPSGGSRSKPVGTLWIAVSGPKGTQSTTLRSTSTRNINIQRFAAAAIDYLRIQILENKI